MDRRKFLMFAGAGTLAATAVGVTGCGGDDSGSKGSGGKSDLSTLTMMLPLYDTSAPAATGEMQQAIEKFIGKKLDISWVPNASYDDKINVTLASDKIPMLMAADKSPTFVRSAEAGAFWELTDKIGKYPELKSDNEQIQKNSSINGKIYGIYKGRDAMRSALSIRKDWLDKLNLELPKSTQDLYDIAKAFHTEKPNGKKDCTGLIIPKWPGGYGSASPYDVIEVWYGAPNKWKVDNGKFVPGFDTDEFFEAVDFIKKMIDEGLVNKDFATLDSAKWNDPFFNGDGGMILDVSSRGLALQALFQEKDPKHYTKYVDMTGTLTGPDGQLHAYPTTGYNGFIAISKQSVRDESGLDEVLKVLAKLNTKEGQVLLNNGIQGKNFDVKDGYAVTINENVKEDEEIGANVKSFAQLGMAVGGYKAYKTKPDALAAKRDAFHKSDLEHAVFDPSLPYVSPTYVSKGAQLDLIVGDALLKYLAGQIDLVKFKSEIQRWHSSGGDQVAQELSDLYQKG
ncbi:extracellular solute-binding protein [Microlunatus elymi]|uniref:Extracellular solute-binding protein n=1 Tax=Microlunatus elymi TaxID=2596828 RepID=A0A516Q2A1_9ACTN|nr:extracellular solute-binding protein [Microlunatus elymi]QDP97565.1 extracellular solute-binding protein [Microlunatus elymi]